MVINRDLNEDGEQKLDQITFENYHGHFIAYDYCPQIGMHWEVSKPETAPIYPVCMQTCCDVFEVKSTMNNRFGADVFITDEIHYDGEFNDRPTYRSIEYPGNGLFYHEGYQGWAYILGHEVQSIDEDGNFKPYAGFQANSICPPEQEQHWINGISADNGDYAIVKMGFQIILGP